MDGGKCTSLHTKNFVALAQPIKAHAKGWKTKVRKISKEPFEDVSLTLLFGV